MVMILVWSNLSAIIKTDFSYKKGDDGKPVIIPEEAEVIQLIFKLYIDGGSTHSIAQELNNKKYSTRSKSGKWSAMLIKRILQNEKYIGDCLLQKTYTIDCISHKANTESNEIADTIKTDIDNSSFELLQYDDVLVRKVVECVKILSKEEISVTFKGGYEIKSELLT